MARGQWPLKAWTMGWLLRSSNHSAAWPLTPPPTPTPCFPEAPLTSQKLLSAQQEKPWDNAQATSKRTHGDKG